MGLKNKQIPEQKTKKQLLDIKTKLLDLLFWLFTIFMWFALAGSIYRSVKIGFHTYNYLQIALVAIFLIVFVFRKHIKFKTKAFFLLTIVYILGSTGIYANGILSTGIYFLMLFTIISGILTNRKWGVISFAISIISLVALAYLDINGHTPNYALKNNYHQTYNSWLMTILVFILVTGVIIVFWVRILNYLLSIIYEKHDNEEAVTKINKLLSKEIESRKKAEEQLKTQVKETQQINKDYETLNKKLIQTNSELERSNILLADAKKKAQEADRLKSSFLSNMSHEIRTPMNAIVGFATLLASTEIAPEDNQKYLNIIQSSTHSLINIINDILTMAKIESGQFTIYPALVNLSEFSDELHERYTREVYVQKDDKVTFEITNSFTTNSSVIVDLESLTQITNKLIDNAIKFTVNGFIKVKISIIDNCFLAIKIDDSGVGIPGDIKDEIFETFRQADLGNKRKYGGTGIGLSIAKGLTILLNGTIEFTSLEGKGTSFSISIPIINKTPQTQGEKVNFELNAKNKTVLVVGKITWDDRTINQILQDTNAILIYVETGFQAIDTLKEYPEIDLIIISLFLPDMNSQDLLKILRKNKAGLSIFAHVAATSDKPVGYDKAIWNYIIDQPFNKQEFLAKLEKTLKSH